MAYFSCIYATDLGHFNFGQLGLYYFGLAIVVFTLDNVSPD